MNSKAILESFKEIILPRDEPKAKQKLKETFDVRKMSNLNSSIELFNLYLVSPSLVSENYIHLKKIHVFKKFFASQIHLEFQLMYPEIDENTLADFWPIITKNVMLSQKKKIDDSLGIYMINNEIRTITKLLNVVPTYRKKINKAISSLITISDDPNKDPMELLTNCESPRIITIYSKAMKEYKYYIEIKSHLISVSVNAILLTSILFVLTILILF